MQINSEYWIVTSHTLSIFLTNKRNIVDITKRMYVSWNLLLCIYMWHIYSLSSFLPTD